MSELKFPKGFLWGAATSSHQVEGGNRNDWTIWEEAGHTEDRSTAGAAADFWHRWREDFELASSMGLTAFRFSIEWSRIEPIRGQFDEAALDVYENMVDDLLTRGIKPLVTVHHFTNPLWIADQGGWSNKRTVEDFLTFADRVVERLAAKLDFWCTINEPTILSGMGYALGVFPPGHKNFLESLKVQNHLASAHNRLYKSIHRIYVDRGLASPTVTFAHHMFDVEPSRPGHPLDRFAAWMYRYLANQRFLGMTNGHRDAIGLNYYFHHKVRFVLGGPLGISREEPIPAGAPVSDLGWQLHPQGLYRLCSWLKSYGQPIYVLESGLADAGDHQRAWYIQESAAAMSKAIAEGADIRSYGYWAFIDTFEWEHGYTARFGLIAVDFPTQRRTLRPSAHQYAELIKSTKQELAHV